MQPQSTIPKWLHTLLMVASVAVVLRWLWGWFGPGKEAVRRQAESFSQMLPLDFKGLLFLGIAIVAAGYLCWRLLTWLFGANTLAIKTLPVMIIAGCKKACCIG